MAAPNQIIENENAHNAAGAPVDPFAVDFFGGAQLAAGEDEPAATEKIGAGFRKRASSRKKNDWYKNLPRITNREAEFSNLLAKLPENLSEDIAGIVSQVLARYTSQPAENVKCSAVSVAEVNLEEAVRKASVTPNVYLSFAAEPENAAAVAVLGADFSARLIDAMLGGKSAVVNSRSELSPIEMTVVEFLAANILSAIADFTGAPPLILKPAGSAAGENFRPFEHGAEFVVNLSAGEISGIVRIYASAAFLKTLEGGENAVLTSSGNKRLSEIERIARAVDLRLQVGKTFLDADTILYLEPGDIVLIEQPLVGQQNGIFGGKLQVFVGSGTNFRLRGAAENHELSDGLSFRLEEMTSEETRRRFLPAKFKMDVKENEPADENNFEIDAPQNETFGEDIAGEQISPALENVQVALRVELAGSKISLRELQNLRAGQIVALGVSPTDPVRLVTDSSEEPVATGELVEIEGQLGVRLTKVFI